MNFSLDHLVTQGVELQEKWSDLSQFAKFFVGKLVLVAEKV